MTIMQVLDIFESNQNRLAKTLGVSPCFIGNWIAGRDKIPSKRLQQMVEHFGVKEEYFIRELSKMEQVELKLKFIKDKYGVGIEDLQQLVKVGAYDRQ